MKQYEVVFYTKEGKPHKMKLWLSKQAVKRTKRKIKEIKK